MVLPLDTKDMGPTGFEGKSLKAIIINWLYHPDFQTRVDAMIELRKHFRRVWPMPDWMRKQYDRTGK